MKVLLDVLTKKIRDAANAPGYNYSDKAGAALVIITLFFFAARFINILDFPSDYTNDEMYSLYNGILRHLGLQGFFSWQALFGAHGTLLAQMTSFLTPAIRENIGYYHVFAVVLNGIYIYGAYLLAGELYDKKTGILAAFAASLSSWSYFTARSYQANMLLPLFTVFCLYFIVMAVRKNGWYYIPAAVTYLLGFNTYLSFLLIIPVVLVILHNGYRENRMGKRKYFYISTAFLFSGIAVLCYIFLSSDMLIRMVEVLSDKKPGAPNAIVSLLLNAANIRYLFVANNAYPEMQFSMLALLNPIETLFFSAGIVYIAVNIKDNANKAVLAMFLFFMLPVLTHGVQQSRFVQALLPVNIITAAGLARLFGMKKPVIAAGFGLFIMFCGIWTGLFLLNYEKITPRPYVKKTFIKYVNSVYGDKYEYLQHIDLDQPDRTLIRLKSFYNGAENKEYTAFTVNAFWKERFLRTVDASDTAEIKIFYSDISGPRKRYPYLLVVLKSGSKSAARYRQFDGLLKQARDYMKGHSREENLAYLSAAYRPGRDAEVYNLLVKMLVADIFLDEGNIPAAIRVYEENSAVNPVTADVNLKLYRCYAILGMQKQAQKNLEAAKRYISSHPELE